MSGLKGASGWLLPPTTSGPQEQHVGPQHSTPALANHVGVAGKGKEAFSKISTSHALGIFPLHPLWLGRSILFKLCYCGKSSIVTKSVLRSPEPFILAITGEHRLDFCEPTQSRPAGQKTG